MEWFPPCGERRPQHQMLPTCSWLALSLIASHGQKPHLGVGRLHTWTSVWKPFDSLTHQTWRFFEITVETLPSLCGNHSKYSCVCYHFRPLLLNSLPQTSGRFMLHIPRGQSFVITAFIIFFLRKELRLPVLFSSVAQW